MAPHDVSSARAAVEPASGLGAALRRRSWILAQAVLVVAGLAVLVESQTPVTYTATVVLLPDARREAASAALPDLVLGGQAELVRDEETVARAAEALGRPVGLVTVDVGEVELRVHVQADDRRQAIDGADAVAVAYLERRSQERAAVREEERQSLLADQSEVERQLDDLTGTEAADPSAELRRAVLRAQLQDVVEAQRALRVGEADAGAGAIVNAATDAVETGPEPVEAGALGALLGFAVGSALVGAQVHTDRRVRTVEEADAVAERLSDLDPT